MKKILFICAAVLGLMATMPAQAQVKFGLKGGLNISKVSLSWDAVSSDNRTGFFVGPMIDITIPVVGFGIDASALYTQSGAKLTSNNTAEEKTLKSIEVPVNLKYNFGLGSTLGAFVAAGPQFGFNVGSDHINEIVINDNSTTFNVGVGIKAIQHLQVGLNYNFSISKLGKYEDGNGNKYDLKKNTWQVSVAYLF